LARLRHLRKAIKKIKDNGEDRDPAKLQEGLKKAIADGNAVNFEAYAGSIAANKLLSPTLKDMGHSQDVEGLQKLVTDNEKGLGLTDASSKSLRASLSTAAAKVHQTEYLGAEKDSPAEAREFQRTIIESMSQNDMAKLSAKAFTDHLDTVMPNFTDQRSANNVPVSTIAEIVNDNNPVSSDNILEKAFTENRNGTLHMLEKLAALDDDRLQKILSKTSKGSATYSNWDDLKTKLTSPSISLNLRTLDPKDFKNLTARLGVTGSAGGGTAAAGGTGGGGTGTGTGTPPPPTSPPPPPTGGGIGGTGTGTGGGGLGGRGTP
jgi:hypothetical protein